MCPLLSFLPPPLFPPLSLPPPSPISETILRTRTQPTSSIHSQAHTHLTTEGKGWNWHGCMLHHKYALTWKHSLVSPKLTSTGFLLRMKKFSALIIMNLMNFLQSIFSISSALGCLKSILKVHTYAVRHNPNSYKLACLMAIDTRIEFIDASIWTFSFSFRLTMSGANRSSLLLLLPDGMPTFHA